MNWLSIFRFEFRYRRNRPATYIFFVLLLGMSFALVTTDMLKGLTGGAIKDNATVVISRISLILFLMMGVLISSAIMGVAVVRDFEHRTDALFFTKPIQRWEYLTGRYLGAMLLLLLTLTAIPLGLMMGEAAPWRDADRLLPFRLSTYWQPYLVTIIPNALIVGSIFFTVGALSRKMLVVFTQGMILLMLYLISGSLLSQIDRRETAALLDPFGMRAMGYITQYWSIAQQNQALLPLAGLFLWNRLLWLGVAALAMAATYVFFSYQQAPGSYGRKKTAKQAERELVNLRPGQALHLPRVKRSYGGWTWVGDMGRLTVFYAKVVMNDLPFLALSIGGLGMFLFSAIDNAGGWYGSRTLPTTYVMLSKMSLFTGLFLFILMVLYVGDLVWKERDVRINLIEDALPVPNWVPLLSKYLGLGLAFGAMLTVAIGLGALIQTFRGGASLIDWRVYATSLYGETLMGLLIYMLLGFFIHVMVNNKFAGHGLMILFFVATGVLAYLGVEHRLLQFNSASLGTYSEMNGFGHYVSPFSWMNLYWLAFAVLLFAAAVVLSVRGSEELFKLRLRIGRHQLTRPILTFGLAALIVFVSSGSYIYYNTNIENRYQNSKESEAESATYEKTLKKYAALPQPRITDVRVQVDIFPETRDFTATGRYVMKNKTTQPIRQIHLQTYGADEMQVKQLTLSMPNRLDDRYANDFDYRMFHLDKPLMPGDSLTLDFKLAYRTKGFRNGNDNVDIVENGTFFTNQYFPGIGYDDRYELGSDDTRKKNGLKPKERMRSMTDPTGLREGVFGDDADQIRFATTISTSPDQIAIAPGYLQKEWTKGGRRYFSYTMDAPITNFYSIVSARYAVRKELYKGKGGNPVNLEIYYHPGHARNLDRMMRGMKASLDYYQTNYGPYQHRQLRIMEFPRYRSYAQSFANTIPFGESMGFVADIDDKKDIDMPFFVTAHEVAHQWWGHQVTEANVKGSAMLSESLAEYSALMVMKHQSTPEKMQQFLEHELDYYLSGRHGESKKEQPLTMCENQSYIHYNKGSHVLYALQDQIGEDRLNQALQTYRNRWNMAEVSKTGIYPTARDLTAELRAVTPDSLRGLLDDWVNAITLYELKTEKVTVKPAGKQFVVTLDVSAAKVRADSLGNEQARPLNEWMWVGVYAPKPKDSAGTDKLLYYQRHRITRAKQQITVRVDQKPDRAGIDPLNLLIDRHPGDNVKAIE
ncbi:ABC transporter permease/M1 family aminopeptidase [Spirosoma utsteinense]|uniref:ABC-type transport system involved in multi-copper enzyme maturation permease subunit n=1 Tax=Spirosoma utsteinense TaxID=2585773 RepID=A0ABR6W3S3_9BACT|nr:M1 family aminopeptidase [Spirosoma utsteinense]MBC3788040.1 ABC-type transport system involved in multi-copper enzyme maturation permease subunit [Spirosoma utsteinense]MBC3791258.1 ABC-type transport system involved in multi-copper enzyme maturation permease subunit [Spirosoma utsteinense]